MHLRRDGHCPADEEPELRLLPLLGLWVAMRARLGSPQSSGRTDLVKGDGEDGCKGTLIVHARVKLKPLLTMFECLARMMAESKVKRPCVEPFVVALLHA